ncbi:hypothetical protein NFI96_031462, partial [Prochilodus magdalenae]
SHHGLGHILPVDFVMDLPNSQGHTTILTVVNRFSRGPVVPGPLDKVLPATISPSPVIVEGEPVYAVRRLLDSRRKGGTLQYSVDWRFWT